MRIFYKKSKFVVFLAFIKSIYKQEIIISE